MGAGSKSFLPASAIRYRSRCRRRDEIFTYGNDDDSKRWPNSLTHHIMGGHYGYPYQFLTAPHRALPIVAGQIRRCPEPRDFATTRTAYPPHIAATCFSATGVFKPSTALNSRKTAERLASCQRSPLVTSGGVSDFRPFSIVASADGTSLWLVDWAHTGWLTAGIESGRFFRLTYTGADRVTPANRPAGDDLADRLAALDHPALAVRLESQRIMAQRRNQGCSVADDSPKKGGARSGPTARNLGTRCNRRRRRPGGDRFRVD